VRSAIVTGASSGIGRAIAIRLAGRIRRGAGDVRRDPVTGGEATAAVIAAAGGSAVHVDADVAEPAACDRLVAAAVERTGALDVLVNNAAIAGRHSKPLVDTDDSDWDAIMAVNLRGPFLLCRAAVRQMLGQPLRDEVRGRIVNITSQHGMVGSPGTSPTASARAGCCR